MSIHEGHIRDFGTHSFWGIPVGVLRLNRAPAGAQWLGANITYQVKAGGAVFNTNGFDASISQPFQHSGAGVDGGLTKQGAGILNLTGTHSYNGITTVDEGTLLVGGSIAGSATMVNATGTLGGAGTVGAVTVRDGGTLAPGAGLGTLRTGPLSLEAKATFALQIDTFAQLTDATAVTGDFSLRD